jgi:hypothetical protein
MRSEEHAICKLRNGCDSQFREVEKPASQAERHYFSKAEGPGEHYLISVE